MQEKKDIKRSEKLRYRLWAYLLDILIIFMLCSLISDIRILNPNYDKLDEATIAYSEQYKDYVSDKVTTSEFYDNIKETTYDIYKYSTTNYIIYLIVIVGYLGVFQKYNNGQTIGKKLLKLKVVSTQNNKVSLLEFILRILPMYIIGVGGTFTIISCIILPDFLGMASLDRWISAVTTCNMLLALVDIEFAIMRRDRRALHDILSNTIVVDE